MNCIIDIGNSRIKIALFQEQELHSLTIFDANQYQESIDYIETIEADACIIASTQQDIPELIDAISERFPTIELTPNTPLPIDISYLSPETLGDDRKAAVVAANRLSPNQPLLVITAGTCFTYNYFDGQSFLGGAISPGIEMRYQAMHDYTGNLPRAKNEYFEDLIGKTTIECLQSGVQQGVIQEVDGIIDQYELLKDNLQVYISGGDTNFFVSRLKNRIFAHPNLVLHGLNDILEYNNAE